MRAGAQPNPAWIQLLAAADAAIDVQRVDNLVVGKDEDRADVDPNHRGQARATQVSSLWR